MGHCVYGVRGADHRQLADMLFAAATDHRYLQNGHMLDFTLVTLQLGDDPQSITDEASTACMVWKFRSSR